MSSIPMPLDKVSCSGPGSGSDQGTFPATDQSAPHSTDCAADEGSLEPTVVMPSMAVAVALCGAYAHKCRK